MYKKIFFSGIGGIGMSALARYYSGEGVEICGSDSNNSDLIRNLVSEGINVNIGQKKENVDEDIDLFVYTLAIKDNNEELLKAKEIQSMGSSLKIMTYAEALGDMTKNKKTIAICGTHGKTTTTAMTFYALKEAGLNIAMIVGSLIENDGKKTNYISHIDKNRNGGELDYMIIEACEYKRSFMSYNPEIIIVTNIEADHLDYYKDLDDIKSAFQDFVNKLPSSGSVVMHDLESHFILANNKKLSDIYDIKKEDLSVPGEHNRENAKLVIALGDLLGLEDINIRQGLKDFKGTWRRQEHKGERWGYICYDDYAHHPKEIEVTIKAFREKYPSENITIAFMPHLYSRTKILFDDFVKSLSLADKVIILPIYAAREPFDDAISSGILSDSINSFYPKKSICLEDALELKKYLEDNNNLNKGIFITLGAGPIDSLYKI